MVSTYYGGLQAGRVRDRDKGGVRVIQADLALCLQFVEEVEKPESEHRTWSFPRCRKPPHTHELRTTESRGTCLVTEAIGNADGVNASDVEESELGWD